MKQAIVIVMGIAIGVAIMALDWIAGGFEEPSS